MKMTTLFPIILLTSICSAVLGAALGYELFQHRSIDELRVHQIEIEDSEGKPRAHLGVEGDGGCVPSISDSRSEGFSSSRCSGRKRAIERCRQFNAAASAKREKRSTGFKHFYFQ